MNITPNVCIEGTYYHGVVATANCKGPNKACKAAHKAGLTWHVIPAHPKNSGKDSWLIMPTHHYATLEEGVQAIADAEATAPEATSDEEWIRLGAEARVPFRTRAGMNHPTRR